MNPCERLQSIAVLTGDVSAYATIDVTQLSAVLTAISAAVCTILSRLYGIENSLQQRCVHVDITMNNLHFCSIKCGGLFH